MVENIRDKMRRLIRQGKVEFAPEAQGVTITPGIADFLTAPFVHLNLRETWDRPEPLKGQEAVKFPNWKPNRGFEIGWGIDGIGFGGIIISQETETGIIKIDSEGMSKAFVLRCLQELVERAKID